MEAPTPRLDLEVRELLQKRKGDWETVAAGAGVSHSWISQFYRDKIPNPGYATLMQLRAFLVDGVVTPRRKKETAQEGA